MQTVRQIERLWTARQYAKLFRELTCHRPEGGFRMELEAGSAAAAAMGIIRLDELNQVHAPLYNTLLRAVLATQEADGGWGDVTLTALCLRGLMLGKHTGGEAIARGLAYLASLQRPEGLWPKIPLRRMPGDAYVSAVVLYHLAEDDRFRAAVRFEDVTAWLEGNRTSLEPAAQKLWDHAALRCRIRRIREPMLVWS